MLVCLIPGGDLQTDLQQADVIVLSATECEATWGNLAIGNGHICTYTDGVTACFVSQILTHIILKILSSIDTINFTLIGAPQNKLIKIVVG